MPLSKIPPKLSRKIFVINFNHSETTLKQGTSLVHKASERERARLVTTESGRGSFSTSRAWFVASPPRILFFLREKSERNFHHQSDPHIFPRDDDDGPPPLRKRQHESPNVGKYFRRARVSRSPSQPVGPDGCRGEKQHTQSASERAQFI